MIEQGGEVQFVGWLVLAGVALVVVSAVLGFVTKQVQCLIRLVLIGIGGLVVLAVVGYFAGWL